MKKKVLVLGSTGLIGHQIYTHLDSLNKYKIFNLSKSKLNNDTILVNAVNYIQIEKSIIDISPDIVINCIGILIENSDLDPELAEEVNAKFPNNLRLTCDKLNIKLIHISTDCVFSGNRGNYHESDLKDSLTIYGKTKALGEIFSKNHLTIRTSVIGPSLKKIGSELFDWFMMQEKEINGYTDSIWSGVSTLYLARMIEFSIENNINEIYNFSSNNSISKYDLLCIINKIFNKNIMIKKVKGIKTNKVLIDNRKLIDFKIPDYSCMVNEMFLMTKLNCSIHPEYKKYLKN